MQLAQEPKILNCLLNITEIKMNFSLLFLTQWCTWIINFLHNQGTKTISRKLKVEFVRETPEAVQLNKKTHMLAMQSNQKCSTCAQCNNSRSVWNIISH